METKEKKSDFLDFSGLQTGIVPNKRLLISVVLAVALYLALSMLPLEAYGENCAKGLGFCVAAIFLMVFSPLSSSIVGILMICTAPLLQLVKWADVKTACGNSSLYPMLGMTIVALGCEFTPFGKRISYWFLYKFGKKPVNMLIAIGVCAAVLSAFVSNTAVIILMSSIINTLLLTMGEKPGESKLGKVAMILVLMAAEFGGIALVNGSPAGNNFCMNALANASGDLKLSVSYSHWTKIAAPIFIVMIIPMCLIFIKWFKVKNADIKMLPPSYYKEQLEAIGPMTGAEWRWIIISIAMVAAMMLGLDNNLAAMLFALISVFPLIGVSPYKQCVKKVPWEMMISIMTIPIIGTIINTSGVSKYIQALVSPLLQGLSPLLLSIILALAGFLMANLLVNAFTGVWTFICTLGTVLAISAGYNPIVIVFPTFLTSQMMWCIGTNTIALLNRGYGWWDMKDLIGPGFISGIFASIVIPVLNYGLCALYGVSAYL